MTENEVGTAPPAIRVEGLRAAYGRKTALRGISLVIEEASVCAVLGRNGAGKSTLIRCLLGHLKPRAGRLAVLGRNPWSDRVDLMDDVGAVPETPDLPPELKIGTILRFCSRVHSNWDDDLVGARLERFDLPLRRPFSSLSRGQKAGLQLIIALASRPKILILDDPTLGLDALARRELYEEVIGDLADRGTTVFLATHDLAGVERLADRVAILDDGRLLLDRPLEQLKAEWSLRLGDDCTLENIFVDVLRKGAAS